MQRLGERQGIYAYPWRSVWRQKIWFNKLKRSFIGRDCAVLLAQGDVLASYQVALKVRSIPRSVKRVIRTYLEILTTVNRQKSAEVIVIAEMSDEGPNPCDCEMQQLPLRLRTQQSRKQRTPTILDQCRNCEKKWRSLAVSRRSKVTVPALVEGMHLLMNQRTEVRIKHMETAVMREPHVRWCGRRGKPLLPDQQKLALNFTPCLPLKQLKFTR